MPTDDPIQRALLKDALVQIRALRAKVKALELEQAKTQTAPEPIAIVGLGCRFPGGANTPAAFWRLLAAGIDAAGPIPPGRWDVDAFYDPDRTAAGKMHVRQGSFLSADEIEGFDAELFGIAPREVLRMDPQQRLLLEVAWEALENAGLPPRAPGGAASGVGVYVGMMNADYAHRQVQDLAPADVDPYILTGCEPSFSAGRLSHCLGLGGPSLVVSTACSSSLVAVHLACQALRAGECQVALAGGANLVLDPLTSVMLSKLGALAQDGRCRAFDAAADGYGRGEGCGVVVLERLGDAIARGASILAVIPGSAMNHDGPSAGLTVPSGSAQEQLIGKALAHAQVTADRIDYLEAHGTGTQLGDPIELAAAARALGPGRTQPLLVGSVKTNVGHLEAAAGIAGLIKVVLALVHRQIPPHLHLRHPSPHVPWRDLPLEVPTDLRAWPRRTEGRMAAISSFGLSGVNAHVIVAEAPPRAAQAALEAAPAPRLQALALSAASPAALEAQVLQYLTEVVAAPDDHAWPDICFAANTARAHWPHRLCITAASAAEARALLPAAPRAHVPHPPGIAFAFSGHAGAQAGIARAIYAGVPAFRRAIDRQDQVLQRIRAGGATGSIAGVITGGDADPATRQVALVAVQCALCDLWRAWGVAPALVLARDTGACAALHAAGALGGDDVLALALALAQPGRTSSDLLARIAEPQVPFLCDAQTGDLRAPALRTPELWQRIRAGTGAGTTARPALPASIALTLEIGPATEGAGGGADWCAGLGEDGWRSLLEAAAALYRRGAAIDWRAVDPGGPHPPVALPTYPFQRKRYWALDRKPDRANAPVRPVPAAADAWPFDRGDARAPLPLRELPQDRRALAVTQALCAEVKAVLQLALPPGPAAVPLDLGLDSLMSSELRRWAKSTFGLDLSAQRLLAGAAIEEIAADLLEQLQAPARDPAPALTPAGAPASRLPLSHGQRALWFIQESSPGNTAYNVGVALRVHAAVDVAALRDAFAALLHRHPSLRATFGADDGQPFQVITPGALAFTATALPDASDEDLRAYVTRLHQIPFDLASGPLFRVSLVTRAPADHVLLLSLHHIVCDGLSCWTLLEELQALYAARDGGAGAALPVTPGDYAGFVKWQTEMLASDEGERLFAFWRERLAGTLPVLALPTDHPRPQTQSYRGASHLLVIPPALAVRLRQLGRAENATLFSTMLAAFFVLLHRWTGQDDIIIGAAAAGRPDGFSGVVGYFVNPLPLRTDLSGDPSFRALLDQVRRATLQALDHQHFPFPLLVERLAPRREPGRAPIFQVDFGLQRSPTAYRRSLGDSSAALALGRYPLDEEEGQFDLSLHVLEDDELGATFKYNRDLFEPATIARMAAAFFSLLEGIVAAPGQRLSLLPVLSSHEQRRVLALGAGPQLDCPPLGAHQLFEQQARRSPTAIAVESVGSDPDGGGSCLTYAALDRAADALAHALRARGVGPNVIVGICLPRSSDLVVAVLGVLKAGGAYLPLDPGYPALRLEFMIRDAQLPLLLTTRALAPGLPDAGVPTLIVDDNDLVDGPALAPVTDFDPERPAYVIYTSGSTGTPKGSIITHRGLTNYLVWAGAAYGVGCGSGAPVSSSIAFDATITSFFLPLLAGGKVVLLPEHDPIEALGALLERKGGFSLLKITPAHLEILSRLLPPEACADRAGAFVIGGEALRGDMLAFWQQHAPGTRLINEYGPTETVVGCCVFEAGAPVTGNVPIGRPIANTQLVVLDRWGNLCPQGVVGELGIGGAGVSAGYLHRPDLTAEKFVPDPFAPRAGARRYLTGDLVRFLPDGNLEFLGRIDQQIKLRGFRIEPAEIEAALALHPGIAECLVTTWQDARKTPALVAYFVARAEAPVPTPAELRRQIALRLPEHMVPAAFVPLTAFPLTANGKIDRAALPPPLLQGTRLAPPRDALEMGLAALWEEVLGTGPVGVKDNFFDLGGHSLLAVRLMARIQNQFGRRLPLSALLRGPTVEEIAACLRPLQGAPDDSARRSSLVPIQPRGHRVPFFCVPGAGGNAIYLYGLARQLGSEQPFYGLQGVGLDGEAPPHTSVEQMAAHYLADLRAVQPRGPYHLGGHSLGGWIAFEMAQQLRQGGEEVGVLALIDTAVPTPEHFRDTSGWDDARWISELSGKIADLLNPALHLHPDDLRGLPLDQQLERFFTALVAAELYPHEAGVAHLGHVLALFKAHMAVRYRLPKAPLPLRITLLRTHNNPDPPISAADPTWGWEAVGPVDVHVLPGEHLTILREPHVQQLGARLAATLGQWGHAVPGREREVLREAILETLDDRQEDPCPRP